MADNPTGGTGCGGEMTADLPVLDKDGAPKVITEEADALALEGLSQDDVEALIQAPENFAEGSVEDFTNIEEPHIVFETAVLFERIRALAVVVKDKQELVSKVVWVQPKAGFVLFTVNTGEVTTQVRVDMVNTSHPLKEDFIIDFKAFYAVVRNSGMKFLIRLRNGNPVVTVLQGDVEFENFNLDKELFKSAAFDFADKDKIQKIEGGLFHRFLVRASASMALANRPEDRRVRVEDGTAFSNFLSSVFIQRAISIKNISFRAIDLLFLKTVLEGVPEFTFFELDKHYCFKTSWMAAAIPKIDTTDISVIKEGVAAIQRKEPKFTISPSTLYRIVSLIRSMVGNSGVAKILPKEGNLRIMANTKSGRSLDFPLAASPEGLEFSINCAIQSLVSSSMLLKKEPIVQAAIDQEGRMIIDGEGVEIVFGSV